MMARLLRMPGQVLIALAIGLIRIYQWTLSPLLGPLCRFEPTCSRYMIGALQKYGLIRGGWKGICRVCRCHPWNPGGFDPP